MISHKVVEKIHLVIVTHYFQIDWGDNSDVIDYGDSEIDYGDGDSNTIDYGDNDNIDWGNGNIDLAGAEIQGITIEEAGQGFLNNNLKYQKDFRI